MATVIGPDAIVCYLTGAPPDLADRAAMVIDGEEDLLVPTVAIAEAGRLLVDTCGIPGNAVAEVLMKLLQRANVAVHGAELDEVLNALLMCKTARRPASFADAMVWASARSVGGKLFTGRAEQGGAPESSDRLADEPADQPSRSVRAPGLPA